MGMARTTTLVVVAVAAAGGLVAWRMVRVLRRRVAAEEARGLLLGATSHRDVNVLREHVETLRVQLVGAVAEQEALVAERAVLDAAASVVGAEWERCTVRDRRDNNGGGQA
jgi:hypothetical protein